MNHGVNHRINLGTRAVGSMTVEVNYVRLRSYESCYLILWFYRALLSFIFSALL